MTSRIPIHALDPAAGADGDGIVIANGEFTIGPVGSAITLSPYATIAATKSASNPTLNQTGAMPENIIKVDDTYWLLYSSRSGTSYTRLHLASATSPEGPWTPYSGNPILTAGTQAWEGTSAYTNGGCIIEHEGTFYLFYAIDTTGAVTPGIGVATSTAITGPYTKYASNPVLSPGATGAWDSLRVQEPDVQIAPDGKWVMAFMAEDSAQAQAMTEKVGIATATSPFGPWAKSPNNPVIGFGESGEWDDGCAADPSLLYENGYWWCIYAGAGPACVHPWAIGLAYALDIEGPWTKFPTNPILDVGAPGTFDSTGVWRGALYREGDVLHLPYGGIPDSMATADAKGGNATLAITLAGEVAGHEAATDPHPQYLIQAEADALYEPLGSGGGAAMGGGELLMQDGVSSPPVPLETEGRDDWLFQG